MKPSERIKREFDRLWATNNYSVPNALRTAIGAYLDEQAEIEQRRRAVTRTIAFAEVGQWDRARNELHRVQLDWLDEPPIGHTVTWLLERAEREGLL